MPGEKPCRDHLGNGYPSVQAMCQDYGIPMSTYTGRLSRGWTQAQALTTPRQGQGPKINHKKPVQDHLGIWYNSIPEMAGHYGITEKVYWSRKRILKWPLEKILTTPVHDAHDTANAVSVTDHEGNTFPSISEMCRHWKIRLSTYRERRKRGWDIGRALTGKETRIATDPVPCEDHLGNQYPSKNAMCRAWGVTRYCYDSRLALGWDKKRALTEKHVVNAKPCTDHTGKQFPAAVYMALYLGFPKYAFHSQHDPARLVPVLAEKYWQDRDCGPDMHVTRCAGFPWFIASYKKHAAVVHFDRILQEYHKNGFLPLPETGVKRPYVTVTKQLAWPWYLCSVDGAPAVMDYDRLIQVHRDSNFGLSGPE